MSEEKQEIDFDPEQLTIITQKDRNMSRARGDSMLKLTANREMLFHRASEQAECAGTAEIGQFYIKSESVVDGNSCTRVCRKYSQARDSQYSRIQAILNDHVNIGPVTEIEVFESAGALVTEVQVPSRQPGNVKSWVRISRGISQHARQFVLKDTEHQSSGAMFSPQSWSCGRPRAQTHGEKPHVMLKELCQSQKLYPLDLVNKFGKIILAKAKHKRD